MTTAAYNRRRPVIDTLLAKVVARETEYKRATQEMLDSIGFAKQGILKYLEVEDDYLVQFEALEMDSHEVAIQVSIPGDPKHVDLEKGTREAKLFTITLPLEVLTAHDADVVHNYIDDMTQFETEDLDILTIEEIDQLLDDSDTIHFQLVTRRMVH